MSKEKHRDSIRKNLDAVKRWRWGILFSVTILFSVILFPNLVITKHQYGLGDVAERDIKSPRDFFIEDTAATEKNRRQAVDAVMTVYDYDAGLAASLTHKVEDVFAKIRSASATPDKNPPQQPAVNTTDGQAASKVQKTVPTEITDKRKFLEENLSIRVSKGAFIELEKVDFSEEISGTINDILKNILDNGVVTNKEILLKESEKGIHLRNVATKEEKELHQLKKFYGLDQAKTMVRIVGQPLLDDLDYGLLNLVVDFVQRLIQPNVTLNRSETEERKGSLKNNFTFSCH